MGLFDYLKKAADTVIKTIEDNQPKINNKEAEVIDSDLDYNNKLITYQKDKFNKEQVIVLFLKSMSYRPHKIGTTADDYPRYMTYDYNILDIPRFHKELIDMGYFCEASFEAIIRDYKVNELKELLASKEQSVKGLKKDGLVELVIKVFTEEEKNKIVKESNLYQVSQAGLDHLEKNKDFLTIVDFQKYSVSYSLFMEYKAKLPQYSTMRDVVWSILNERLNYYSINCQYGMLRGVYLNMAQFLEEEKPSIDVLYNYILCLYYDINLTYTQQQMSNKYIDNKMLIEFLSDNPLAPAIITKIKEYASYHDDKIFDKLFAYEKLPYKFISDNDFKDMVNDIYNSSFFEEKKYINIAIANATEAIKRRKI